MDIAVRRYQPADRPALVRLEAGTAASAHAAFRHSRKRRTNGAAENQILHVAESSGLIVGVIQVKRHRFRGILRVPRLIAVPPADPAVTRLALLRPVLVLALTSNIEKVAINAQLGDAELMLLNAFGWHTLKRSRGTKVSCYPDLYTPHNLKLKALLDDDILKQFAEPGHPLTLTQRRHTAPMLG